MQRDNSTLAQKVAIRQIALGEIESPVVMETHGGTGQIFKRCYSHITDGVVFEKDAKKAGVLALQRPTWAVYEADCLTAIGGGVGGHLLVNFVDLDLYGDPWPVIEAFFTSQRPRPDKLAVVVNDGLRQNVRMGGAWNCGSLQEMVDEYGNDLYDIYLEVCRELIKRKAVQAGYDLDRFNGYYCGQGNQMTHYLAVFNYAGESV